MNWYNRLKFAQIWNIESDGGFLDEVQKLYELEYKRSMIKQNPFKGVDKRKENILANIEKGVLEAIDVVREPLAQTLQQWLKSHALTDPDQWAKQRNKPGSPFDNWDEYYESTSEGPISRIIRVVDEYNDLTEKNSIGSAASLATPNWDRSFVQMMQENGSYHFPSMKNITNTLIPDRQEMLIQELQSEGLEEFNRTMGTQFATEEEAEEYIYQATAEQLGIDASDLFDYYDLEGLAELADQNGLLDNLIFDINKNIVFPAWYGKWSNEGIDDTREAVEQIYQELMSAKTIDQIISAVNLALNAAHQTGDMIDYLEDYGNVEGSYGTKQFLDNLSAGEYVEKWNEELRAIGVEI